MSQAVNNTLSRLTNLALEVDDDFWFCLTDLFIQRLLQIRPGPPKTLGFFRQDFSQARCSSCHPATSVEAHEHSTTRSVRRLLFVYPSVCLFAKSILHHNFQLYLNNFHFTTTARSSTNRAGILQSRTNSGEWAFCCHWTSMWNCLALRLRLIDSRTVLQTNYC